MSPRTVSCGSSRTAVRRPTPSASYPARSHCTQSRAAAPEIHCERPSASAMKPSSEWASFTATNGRSRRTVLHRNGAFSAAASCAPSPRSTSTPAARSRSIPPPASGSGSRIAATTRRTPAAISASTHGAVLPWCRQGSRDTTSVAPWASPQAASAATSACGPPNSACQPSPITSPSRISTAPTIGFGATRPQPRSARSSARLMAARSASLTAAPARRRPAPRRR